MEVDGETRSARIRILIVDDHPAVRKGLALLLEPEGIKVCGEAQTGAEALAFVEERKPDLAIVDLSLGDENGLDLLGRLSRCAMKSLVYSMHEDGRNVQGAFAAGAFGYVTKRETHAVLIEAIDEVAAGRRFLSPRAAAALAEHIASAPAESAFNPLSAQEQQVYRFLEEGQAIRNIGGAMGISPRTVESYCERICAKLGLAGMRELRHHASRTIRSTRV